jgi:acyl phosphate:glycerol-3-phosphate acyltransferase
VRDLLRIAIPAAAGYLLGSIPVADLAVGRRGVDLRLVGDRNPGYWNARETVGGSAARPVLVGDVGKGAAAALIGRAVAGRGRWWPPVIGTGAAMVGHAWPLFARFRGGRAVAAFGGGAAVMSPPAALVAAAAGVAGWRVRSSGATGVRLGFVAYPLAQLAVDGARRTAATGVLMTFIGFRFWQAAQPRPDDRSACRDGTV